MNLQDWACNLSRNLILVPSLVQYWSSYHIYGEWGGVRLWFIWRQTTGLCLLSLKHTHKLNCNNCVQKKRLRQIWWCIHFNTIFIGSIHFTWLRGFYCGIVSFHFVLFFEKGSHYVALVGMELIVLTRRPLDLWGVSCFCLVSAGIKDTNLLTQHNHNIVSNLYQVHHNLPSN